MSAKNGGTPDVRPEGLLSPSSDQHPGKDSVGSLGESEPDTEEDVQDDHYDSSQTIPMETATLADQTSPAKELRRSRRQMESMAKKSSPHQPIYKQPPSKNKNMSKSKTKASDEMILCCMCMQWSTVPETENMNAVWLCDACCQLLAQINRIVAEISSF